MNTEMDVPPEKPWARLQRLQIDAERYNWLRDRMEVRYEASISSEEKRATISMRVGHSFLDSNKCPTEGWTDQKYFDECRNNVDAAIDYAMTKGIPE